MSVALAAAGTGGHVYPALAVADALVAAGTKRDDIVFFGGSRMEAETVPEAGYDFVEVEIRGLRRSLSLSNLSLPRMVWQAADRIKTEMRSRDVTITCVFGGYIAVPAALAAQRAGSKIIVHEQNAYPGLANRLVSPWALETLVAFPEALPRFRRSREVGNPLRSALVNFDREALRDDARRRYGLSERGSVLGVLGGSLGAQVLNDATVCIAADSDPDDLEIIHLTGELHHTHMAEVAMESSLRWITTAYEPEMEWFFAASDVVLSRAGALAVSELAATGTPSLLVPLEATHQGENARFLEESKAARVIRQVEADRIPDEVQQLMNDKSRLVAMSRAALSVATPRAAAEMASVLLRSADD